MPTITLFFKLHMVPQPNIFRRKAVGTREPYFNEQHTRKQLDQLCDNCYLPVNEVVLGNIRKTDGAFRLALGISGTLLEMLRDNRPDVLNSFRNLLKTGAVELTGETYYHSLSWLHSRAEFVRQVNMHRELVHELFGVWPRVFRHTELIYENELAAEVRALGFDGLLCEGMERHLKGRSPNFTYAAPGNGDFGLLLRNVRLSDDISFRFDDPHWNEQPLTAEKFARWIHQHHEADCKNINLFMDYETFGIHKPRETGILDFLDHLPGHVLSDPNWNFALPAETLHNLYPADIYDVPHAVSWEGKEKACCVRCENAAQHNTLRKIYGLEKQVMASGDAELIETWSRLQAADYFYYMGEEHSETNWDGRYISPFACAEEAAQNLVNILSDFEIRLIMLELNRYKKTGPDTREPVLY